MTETIIVVLLAVLGSWIAVLPLLNRNRLDLPDVGDVGDAEMRKAESLQAIIELESELAAGAIGQAEFETLRAERGRDALRALRELDVTREMGDDAIEAEIARLRAQLCPNCGAPRAEGVRCESCGT
jgi:hypothetical protein